MAYAGEMGMSVWNSNARFITFYLVIISCMHWIFNVSVFVLKLYAIILDSCHAPTWLKLGMYSNTVIHYLNFL